MTVLDRVRQIPWLSDVARAVLGAWRQTQKGIKRAVRKSKDRVVRGVRLLLREILGAWRQTQKGIKRAVRKSKNRAVRGVRLRLRDFVEQRLEPHPNVLETDSGRRGGVQIEAADAVRESITEMARGTRPIVVGPWLSEAGFELLYWIPFVRWAKTYGNIRADRLIIVSRGGAAAWYDDVSTRYVDLLTLYSPEEFQRRNDARITEQDGQKQTAPTVFEREIFNRVAASMDLEGADWLHPSIMYGLFRLFWMQLAPVSIVHEFTRHRRLVPARGPLPVQLPARYIAVKFYSNASFPDTPDNQRFVTSLLRRLTASHDVVLLNTGISLDDHAEFPAERWSRLHRLDRLLEPADNLRVQTRIVEDAVAYVGTYGGFSYLAPLVGTDAVTFYSEVRAFRHDHLDLAQRVFEQVGGGRFIAVPPSALPILDTVVGAGRQPSGASAVH